MNETPIQALRKLFQELDQREQAEMLAFVKQHVKEKQPHLFESTDEAKKQLFLTVALSAYQTSEEIKQFVAAGDTAQARKYEPVARAFATWQIELKKELGYPC